MSIKWKEGWETTTVYRDGAFARIDRPCFMGRVLGTMRREERIMSDVWATVTYAEVWNGTEVERVRIGDSETGMIGAAYPDADREATRAADAWRDEQAEAARRAEVEQLRRRAEARAKAVEKGKRAIVARGRKVPQGITGVVIWIGPSRYGRDLRAGLRDEKGTVHWLPARHLDVLDWREHLSPAFAA